LEQHKIDYDEKTLRSVMIYDNGLDPKDQENMQTKATRYTNPIYGLFINPNPKVKKGGKKKKKKKK
jgi:hypothetical protein